MGLSRRTFGALAGTTVLGLALGGSGGTATGPAGDGRVRIGRDRYALLVDGERLVLRAGEAHPFRLPSPSLWRDVLQKMRAHGYNTVRVPVPWLHHSPAPGRHDFTGVRDLDLFLRTAAETGLYVILRPGPYLGADLDGGGLPGWLTASGVRARTADPAYLRHADAWLTAVNDIAVRHLRTNGAGPVLLYQIENPGGPDPAARAYREHLRRKVRADGIDVPLLHDPAGDGPDGRPDPWGGAGYGQVRRERGAAHRRRLLLTGLADGDALPEADLAFGGTSWGWLPAPSTYTSYDRAAPIDEARRPTAALAPAHQLGHLLRSVPGFARLERAADAPASDGRITVRHLADPDTGAHAYVLRNDSAERVTATLPGTGIETPVTVAARDTRLLVAGLRLGGRKLLYSTAQPMLFLSAGRQDVAVFAGRRGESAQVALECPSEPTPMRLDVEPAWSYGDGRLHVTVPLGVGGLARVRVEGGGSDRPLLLLFADDATSLRLWPYDTPSGPVLVYGPALLRGVRLDGATAHLTGDTTGPTGLEVWGPRGLTRVTWNGTAVRTRISASQSLLAERMLPGVGEVALPALDGWRRRTENPEAAPDFDDSAWPAADRTAASGGTPAPDGQPVLLADEYGFHHGDVWYRARLTDASGLTKVSLAYRTGTLGLLMAWLDGVPLGTHRMPAPDDGTADRGSWTATAAFRVPKRLRGRAGHVLSVLVRPMQRDGEGTARGLTAVAFEGASPRASWRIQGRAAPDPVRGPLNNGGLYGERAGWHLPGHDDGDWEPAELPRADRRQGVTWYRTAFRLSVDPGVDASVGLVLDDDPERAYRVQVFLNGWNLGQYVNDVGPQHTFVLPGGVLRTRGANTLALAVLSDGTTPAGPGRVRLALLGAAAGGVPVRAV
ncbi:beta-galactosidase [Streptomyces glaucus]|uniref:beta-galactosidase n=1 Tax=Streptomyces glaucus TaxID=284029 RepID=A0ABN3K8R1_9ACTN